MARKDGKGLPYVIFPDIIGCSYNKPAMYLWMDRNEINAQKNKEKLVFAEISKSLLEREKEFIEEEKRKKAYNEALNYSYWRIFYKDGIVEAIVTSKLLVNFSKSKIGKFSKDVHYIIKDVPKEEPCLENFIRIKFDLKAMKSYPKHREFLDRAEKYASTLVGHIPDSSSKHISDKQERVHLEKLKVDSPEDYCRYQTCRIYYYLKKVAFKRIDFFEAYWDVDDIGRYWLVGARIFKSADDQDESKLAKRIEQRTKQTNEYLTPLMEMLTAKVHYRLKLMAFEHFASIVDLVDTLGLPHSATIDVLLPGSQDTEPFAKIASKHTEAREQGDSYDPCVDKNWNLWLEEVYFVLYANAVPEKRIPDLHGNQLDRHAESIKTTFSRLIINQFPSLSYIFSNKSENAYKKAKSLKKSTFNEVTIKKDVNSKSMGSFNGSRIVSRSRGSSTIYGRGNVDTPVKEQFRLNSRYPSVANIAVIKSLEEGLKKSKGKVKLRSMLDSTTVNAYIENFCQKQYALPLALPSKDNLSHINSTLVGLKEEKSGDESRILDRSANHLAMSTYNPYTKERIVTLNKSIDLRDQTSFDLDQPKKHQKQSENMRTTEDSLVKSKNQIGYLSLPKILGIKSKLRSQVL